MGCWGMGVTQSDEYCEIYERFMEEYDEGKPLADITKDILDDYLEEFEETDGVLHDVYFALGKAQWMCGGISEAIYNRVRQIIESGDNILFFQELEATETDLKLRKKNLDKFFNSISSPRKKARKRKTPESKYVPQAKPEYPALPKIHKLEMYLLINIITLTVFLQSSGARNYVLAQPHIPMLGGKSFKKSLSLQIWKMSILFLSDIFLVIPFLTQMIIFS